MPPSLRDRLLGRSADGAAAAATPRPRTATARRPVANAGTAGADRSEMRVQPAHARRRRSRRRRQAEASKVDPRAVRAAEVRLSAVEQLKLELHRKLVERLDLEALERITDEALLTTQIRHAVIEFLRAEQAPLSATEREEIVEQIIYEVTGLGPIEPLFRDRHDQRHPRQRPEGRLHRAPRQAVARRTSRSATTRTCSRSSTAS